MPAAARSGERLDVQRPAHRHTSTARAAFASWRYTDRAGHECAFYDTALLASLRTSITVPGLPAPGVAVLDMADPSHPVQTATLTAPACGAARVAEPQRGAAGCSPPSSATGRRAGLLSIYEVGADCRKPVLASTTRSARFGRESGWSPDGATFWVAGGEGIAAVDVSDPERAPRPFGRGGLRARDHACVTTATALPGRSDQRQPRDPRRLRGAGAHARHRRCARSAG